MQMRSNLCLFWIILDVYLFIPNNDAMFGNSWCLSQLCQETAKQSAASTLRTSYSLARAAVRSASPFARVIFVARDLRAKPENCCPIFPLIMYLGLKSIMILKILISIINLYIYISGSCFQYHGVSTPVSKVWLKNAPDPFSAQLWWQHWATRLWCDGFMSRCYNEWLNSIDSIDTLSWCKSNANI